MGNRLENEQFRNKVIWYTFLLSILVVLIHSVNFADTNTQLQMMIDTADVQGTDFGAVSSTAARVENALANTLGQMAVPGFFLMSGYLFFRGLDSGKVLLKKLRSRVDSLIIPYVTWNLMYSILYMITGKAGWSPENIVQGVFVHKYNPVFWYIAQLIFCVLAGVLVFYLSEKKVPLILVPAAVLILMLNGIVLPLINMDALIYFSLGATMAASEEKVFERDSWSVGAVLLTGAWLLHFFRDIPFARYVIYAWDNPWKNFVMANLPELIPFVMRRDTQNVIITIERAMLCVGCWYSLPGKILPQARSWMRHSFVLYATHYPVTRLVRKILSMLQPGAETGIQQSLRLAVFLCIPILAVIMAEIILFIGRKCIPKRIQTAFFGGRE